MLAMVMSSVSRSITNMLLSGIRPCAKATTLVLRVPDLWKDLQHGRREAARRRFPAVRAKTCGINSETHRRK
jgi:hypothetical protein